MQRVFVVARTMGPVGSGDSTSTSRGQSTPDGRMNKDQISENGSSGGPPGSVFARE